MTTIKETAKAYEAPATSNISELSKFSIDVELKKEEHTNKEGKPFTMWVAEIDDKRFRVPVSVLGQIKAILIGMPSAKFVKVTKTGTGMASIYHTLPVMAVEEEVIA